MVHLVNRDYAAMCQDYYSLEFMDPGVDTAPIAPALAQFFDNVLDASVQELNFKVWQVSYCLPTASHGLFALFLILLSSILPPWKAPGIPS